MVVHKTVGQEINLINPVISHLIKQIYEELCHSINDRNNSNPEIPCERAQFTVIRSIINIFMGSVFTLFHCQQ